MCQNEVPSSRIENDARVSFGVTDWSDWQSDESATTVGVEPQIPLSEAGGFLEGMSNDQLLAVLVACGILIIVTAWYVDSVYQRLDLEIHRFKHWWRWKIENSNLRFELPGTSAKLNLSNDSTIRRYTPSLSQPSSAGLESARRTNGVSGQSQVEFRALSDEFTVANESEPLAQSELAHECNRVSTDGQIESLQIRLREQEAQIDSLRAALRETSENADLLAGSVDESDKRYRELTNELAELRLVDERSKSDLADARNEIEELTRKASVAERELLASDQEAREKGRLADTLAEEKIELASGVKKLENQVADAEAKLAELSDSKKEIEAQLKLEIDDRELTTKEFESEISRRESQLADFHQELASLTSAHEVASEHARLALDDVQSKLSREQKLHNDLKERSKSDQEELSLRAARILEQESRLKSAEDDAKTYERELAETLELLEKEQVSRIQLQKNVEMREAEMNALEANASQLQNSLDTLRPQLAQVEEESDKRLSLLNDERMLRAEAIRKLEACEMRVEELEKEASAPTVSVADYHVLVRKLTKYKSVFREGKSLIDGLVVQKNEMSDLASEYLAMARTIRNELDEEREVNQDLRSKLEEANHSAAEFNEQEINRLADERARAFVLNLKEQFEQKIKQKNELIRELRGREIEKSAIR